MLIDWFTVAAQLVNFLVLVWLLRKYLYRPVLKAIGERERKIASELERAATLEKEASLRKSEWQRKNDELEQKREEMLREAASEAEQTKRTLLADARKEYDDLQARLRESLRREREELEQETVRRFRNEVFAMADKVLGAIADTTLEERIVQVFCRHLETSGEEEIGEMKTTMAVQGRPALVRSMFELDPGQRALVEAAVNRRFAMQLPLQFETSGERGTGIELCVNGRCLSWTLDAALDSLRSLAEAAEKTQTGEGSDHDETSRNDPAGRQGA
jgi:F-type H+-transporting ATPase subunit b